MIDARANPTTSREQISAFKENLRTFRIAAWLGWQIEGNWADPLVFFIFTILRPMASALIIVIMYNVIAGGQRDDFFEYLYISNAFFVLVVQVMAGLSWTIIDDRENYKMLKYIYTSPARQFAYLIGRAVAKVLIGLLTTLLLLATGVFFLGLSINLATIDWGMLAVYFPLGMVILGGFGIMLAGISLVIARNGGFIGEVVAGLLLLFSGAYFPPDILPPVLREISLLMPTTYWLEAMRRALTGGILMTDTDPPTPISPTLAAISDMQLAGILIGCAIVSAVGSIFFYRWVENAAKERGMIDRLTGY
jgi:ABC-2 type transport system permease protein